MPQTSRIGIDHRLQLRTARLHRQELVHLFLIFHDREARLGVLKDKLHFLGYGILIERYRHPTQALGCGHGPVEVRTVVADDRYLVPACQAHGCQPTGQRPHFVVHLAPAPGLPDTESFFTHGNFIGVLSGTVEQAVWETYQGHDRGA